MRIDFFAASALAAYIFLLAAPQPTSAQTEPETCAGAVASARVRPTAATIEELGRCRASGPVALADIWKESSDSGVAEARALAAATMRLHDGRLFDVVRETALAITRSSTERLAALEVLTNYFNSSYAPSIDDLAAAKAGMTIPERLGGSEPGRGSVPVPADVRVQVGKLLADLSLSDPDSVVRRAAHWLRQALAYSDPASTPLPTAAISLVAGCGREVFLRSTADIDVDVRLRTASGSFSRTYGVRGGSQAKPGQRDLALPTGTMVAEYGGREVARLSNRKGLCAPGKVRW
jgi:hypothetical protein